MPRRSQPAVRELATVTYGCPLLMPRDEVGVFLCHARGLPGDLGSFLYWEPVDHNLAADQEGVAVIPVVGSLSRGMFWDDYLEIRQAVDRAISSPQITGVVLDVHSPGGQVPGAFDLAEHLLSLRGGAKPILALANDQATSAAYLIASACDEVWVSSTAQVGSIGAMAVHVDRSQANRQAGLRYSELVSGARKNDGSPNAPLSDAARDSLQAAVDQAASTFVEFVGRSRGLQESDVWAQEAAVYVTPQEIIQAGLADTQGSLDQITERARSWAATTMPSTSAPHGGSAMTTPTTTTTAAAPAAGATPTPPPASPPQAPAPVQVETPAAPAAATPAVAPTPTELAQPGGQVIPLANQTAAEARADTERLVRLCTVAGVPELAATYLSGGYTSDQVGEALLREQAVLAEQGPNVDGHHSGTTRPVTRAGRSAQGGDPDPIPTISASKVYAVGGPWNPRTR